MMYELDTIASGEGWSLCFDPMRKKVTLCFTGAAFESRAGIGQDRQVVIDLPSDFIPEWSKQKKAIRAAHEKHEGEKHEG